MLLNKPYLITIKQILIISLIFLWLFLVATPPAFAKLEDDSYDGNIFALYAGNGALIPPKVTLAESIKIGKPALLLLYTDDSRDCKQYSTVISQLQAYYGRAANFIAIRADSIIPTQSSYLQTDPGYYYHSVVPQTVLFDQSGKAVFNAQGKIAFEQIDDVFREIFKLQPRSQSIELKLKPLNEINNELTLN